MPSTERSTAKLVIAVAVERPNVHTWSDMSRGQGYRLLWQTLRVTVRPQGEYWQAFVYDEKNCVILHRAESIALTAAKAAAVEFALCHLFGAAHGHDPEGIAELLPWESVAGEAGA